MIDPFFYASAGLSVITICAYLVIIAKGRRKMLPRLADGVFTILSTAGFVSGIKVCALTFNYNTLQNFDAERIYVFLGGIALIWVSTEAVGRVLYGTWKEVNNNPVIVQPDGPTNENLPVRSETNLPSSSADSHR